MEPRLIPEKLIADRKAGWTGLRKRVFKYPGKRVAQTFILLFHFRKYRKFYSMISKSSFRDVVESDPSIPYKFIGKYLARFFSARQRLDILAHHYEFINASFAQDSNRLFVREGFVIWSKNNEGNMFSIELAIPRRTEMEGELCAVFKMNGKMLHTMTFTILPGEMIGIDEYLAIFVGGSQGEKGHTETIRQASKALGEICPAKMLLISLQALGRALGIGTIAGVSCRGHICPTVSKSPEDFSSLYDSFWRLNGGESWGEFFRMKTEISEKPSTSLSASHRARARRKRALQHALLNEITLGVERYFTRPNVQPLDWKPKPQETLFEPESNLTLQALHKISGGPVLDSGDLPSSVQGTHSL
jgi:uncharacterized protein VirK/YbjX